MVEMPETAPSVSSLHGFIQNQNKMSFPFIPQNQWSGTVVDTKGTSVNKTDQNPMLKAYIFEVGRNRKKEKEN